MGDNEDSSFEVLLEFKQSRKPLAATRKDLLFKIEQHLGSIGQLACGIAIGILS